MRAEVAAAAAGRHFSITTREYDELVMTLGGQRTLLDKKRGVSSEPAVNFSVHSGLERGSGNFADMPFRDDMEAGRYGYEVGVTCAPVVLMFYTGWCHSVGQIRGFSFLSKFTSCHILLISDYSQTDRSHFLAVLLLASSFVFFCFSSLFSSSSL